MSSLSGTLVEPPDDPRLKTHFLANKNANVWVDYPAYPANQLALPSPQASLFRAFYAFRVAYVTEMYWPRKPGKTP